MDKPQRSARRAEKDTVKRQGGRLTPASGAGDVKGDHQRPGWTTEVKSTSAHSYRLHLPDLATAEKVALAQGNRMAFLVCFVAPPGHKAKRYVVMTEDDYLELTGDEAGEEG